MVIDAARCIGCHNCVTSCKDEYVGNDYLVSDGWPVNYSAAQPNTEYGYVGQPWSSSTYWIPGHLWMHNLEVERGTFPFVKAQFHSEPCMHCSNPPCQTAATGGAIYTRPDGIVIIDPTKSAGQTQLVAACPYGRIYWNSNTELPQKCTFCAHLVDQGLNPRCVDACPQSVLTFGDLDNPNSAVAKLLASSGAQPLHPEYGTSPNVFYIGLEDPWSFLSGTVEEGPGGNYVVGATVTLTSLSSSGGTWSTVTDNYGFFDIDGLSAGQMYTLSVSQSGFMTKEMLVYLDTSKNVGYVDLFKP